MIESFPKETKIYMEEDLVWKYCIIESDTSYLFKGAKFEGSLHFFEKYKFNKWKRIENVPKNCSPINIEDLFYNLDNFIHW